MPPNITKAAMETSQERVADKKKGYGVTKKFARL